MLFYLSRKNLMFILMIVMGLMCFCGVSEGQGVCQVGDVIQPGESCRDPGTENEFSVLANGSGRYLFITAEEPIRLIGNINGKKRNFIAEKRADDKWVINAVTGGGVRNTDPPPERHPTPARTSPKLIASSKMPLAESTLDGSVITLTLEGATYERWLKDEHAPAFKVSGIAGVRLKSTFDAFDPFFDVT